MKKFFFVLIIFSLFVIPAKSQIVGESTASKWETVASVGMGTIKVRCRIEKRDEGDIKVYHMLMATSNRYDNFCLTLGEIDDAIKTCEYLYDFSENEELGVHKTFELLDKRSLGVKIFKIMGTKCLKLHLSDCAGDAEISIIFLRKIIKKLKEVRGDESE